MLKRLRHHTKFFKQLNTNELSLFVDAWIGLLAWRNEATGEFESGGDHGNSNYPPLDESIVLAVSRAARYHFFSPSESIKQMVVCKLSDKRSSD